MDCIIKVEQLQTSLSLLHRQKEFHEEICTELQLQTDTEPKNNFYVLGLKLNWNEGYGY